MKLLRNKLLLAETLFVLSLAAFYVMYYLIILFNQWEKLYDEASAVYDVPGWVIKTDIGDFYVRTNVQYPIIAAALIMAAAWLIFHTIVVPRIRNLRVDLETFLLFALSALLVFTSLFIYHYFRDYFRYYLDGDLHPNGIKIYSLFRKRTLVSDFAGVMVSFTMLEMAIAACRKSRKMLMLETDLFYRIMSYVPMLLLALLLFVVTLTLRFQVPLWTGNVRYILYFGASGIIVWLMQEMIATQYSTDVWRNGRKFFVLSFGFTSVWLLANFLVWACYSYFSFRHPAEYMVMLLITLFAAVLIAILRNYFFSSKRKLEGLSTATLAELAQLRAQLNPHFLFNALNSLYTAALRERNTTTAEGIQRLADMMRFMLSENNHERITLEKEVEYLENYLYIQRLRVDETQGVDIQVTLTTSMPNAYIAPMMLIPFVENAFKHGISHRSPSWIHITLTVEDGKLEFRVSNSRHRKTANDPEELKGGIGMPNIRKRLELVYPHRYTLHIKETNEEYVAELTLQLW